MPDFEKSTCTAADAGMPDFGKSACSADLTPCFTAGNYFVFNCENR